MNLNPLHEPSRFEKFWGIANAILRDDGMPELGLKSARQLFDEMHERARFISAPAESE